MKRFFCHCKTEIYFDNHNCDYCHSSLAFHPQILSLISGKKIDRQLQSQNQLTFNLCANRDNGVGCNWLILDNNNQCISCRTTEVIPNQNNSNNQRRWANLEKAKKWLFYSLLQFGLPLDPHKTRYPLRFHFLEDQVSDPNSTIAQVITGHHQGLITINCAEADDSYLVDMQEQMGEKYRTLLGHFRHEIGHYYWYELVDQSSYIDQFREIFGDESKDYQTSLDHYYQKRAQNLDKLVNWQEDYISVYSSSHPFEDWAETWAHSLHMLETLETANSYDICGYNIYQEDFNSQYLKWLKVTQIMNSLNRSMGLNDPYPFVLKPKVKQKLEFIYNLLIQKRL